MTTFVLKLIAIITMTIDHIGYVMAYRMDTDYLRAIGRLAFPIYAFMITEGCARTRNIKKYLIRLGLFALISEIPFDLFSQNVPYYPSFGTPVFFNLNDQNIFFTLLFGALSIYCLRSSLDAYKATYTPENPVTAKKLLTNPKLYRSAVLLAALFICAYFFRVDYGLSGVLLITSLYLARWNKLMQLVVLTLFMFYIYIIKGGFNTFFTVMFIGSLFTIPIIAAYNEKPGPRPAWLKWLFYAYYPAHLTILAVVNIMHS